MNNPLFKPPQDPLSPGEEAEITQELAEAYRQHEISENHPEYLRLLQNIQKRIQKENNKI